MSLNETFSSSLSAEQIDSLNLDNPFWRYSLSLWRHDSIQNTLLALQDEQGMRVNWLLFAMWLGLENIVMEPHLNAIAETTRTWHEQIVSPLRQIRKHLPKHSLRTNVQQAELQAEQIEQALLFDLASNFHISTSNTPIDTLIANLIASGLPERHLSLCIRVCLPDYSDSQIQAQISQHCN